MPDATRQLMNTLEGRARFMETAGRPSFLVLPPEGPPAARTPWVWYAPTLTGVFPDMDHQWLFARILASGSAIAGMDVGESWGNPRGIRLYGRFYDHLVACYPLAGKPSLLVQSRGGPMLYNWAADNPEKVRCIAGIFPVCDLAALPDPELVSSAYGMGKSTFLAKLKNYNPIDRLSPLAEAGIPILHVHGGSDELVPLEKHSQELSKRYRRLGGTMDLVVIPGLGHVANPEYFRCRALADFLTSASTFSEHTL